MKGGGQVPFACRLLRVWATSEQLKRLGFGGCCERYVSDARETRASRHFCGKDILTADLATVL